MCSKISSRITQALKQLKVSQWGIYSNHPKSENKSKLFARYIHLKTTSGHLSQIERFPISFKITKYHPNYPSFSLTWSKPFLLGFKRPIIVCREALTVNFNLPKMYLHSTYDDHRWHPGSHSQQLETYIPIAFQFSNHLS